LLVAQTQQPRRIAPAADLFKASQGPRAPAMRAADEAGAAGDRRHSRAQHERAAPYMA
jgi:hypothetical protein